MVLQVKAEIHYRDAPEPDAVSLPRRLVNSSKTLHGYRVAGPAGSTYVKTLDGYVPMQHDGIDVLRPIGAETFLSLTGANTICNSDNISDVNKGKRLHQGDVVVGCRVISKTGGVMVKTSHLGGESFIPMVYGGIAQLKSLGKAPGAKAGKAFQLISFKADPKNKILDVRCASREEAVPRLMTLKAASTVTYDTWEIAFDQHILFANQMCTEGEYRLRKMTHEIQKRSVVFKRLKERLFDQGDKEVLIKCVMRWITRAQECAELDKVRLDARLYKAKLHEASSAAAELITQYGATLGLVHTAETEQGNVRYHEFCQGFSLTQSPLIEQVFKSFDVEGDGRVRYDDFSRLLESYSVLDYEGRVEWIFRLWDSHKNGRLTSLQVMDALKSAAASPAALQSMYRRVQQEYAAVSDGGALEKDGVDIATFKMLSRKFGTALVYPAAPVMDCVITHTYSDPDSVTRGFLGGWARAPGSTRPGVDRPVGEDVFQDTMSGCVGLGWFFQ